MRTYKRHSALCAAILFGCLPLTGWSADSQSTAGVAAGAPPFAAGLLVGALPASLAAAREAAGQAAAVNTAELQAFKKAIRAKYDLKEKAFAAHDAETIVTQFYSPDVISVGEGEGIYIGREQIRPLYRDVVKSNRVKVESIYTFVDGNAGWDWADFHVFPTDGKSVPFTFAILFLWGKVQGQWLCKGDFFVTGSLKTGKLAPPPAAGSR